MIRTMNIRPLAKELQEKAVKELNEEPERIEENLEKFREWLKKQPHLNIPKDDQHLISFLRGSKWSLHVSTQKLDNYYTLKTLIKEFFECRDPLSEGIQAVLRSEAMMVLPRKKGDTGPTVGMFLCNEAAIKLPLVTLIKSFFMTMDVLMKEDDNIAVSGFIILCDYGNATTDFLVQFTPSIMKKFFLCIQSLYPMRMKGYIGINAAKPFVMLYDTFVKPFLSRKVKNRITFTSETNWSAFNDLKTVLPKEYGGNNPSIKELTEQWSNKLVSYRSWFLDNDDYNCNENLRPGKSKCYRDEIGMEGTFRRLIID